MEASPIPVIVSAVKEATVSDRISPWTVLGIIAITVIVTLLIVATVIFLYNGRLYDGFQAWIGPKGFGNWYPTPNDDLKTPTVGRVPTRWDAGWS
jgi:hypothetical protein